MSSKNRKLKEWLNHKWDFYEYGQKDFCDKDFAKRQASKYYRRVQKKEIIDGLNEYEQGDDDMANCIVIESSRELSQLDGELVYLKYDSGIDSGYYRVNHDVLIREAPEGQLCVKSLIEVFGDSVQVLRIR